MRVSELRIPAFYYIHEILFSSPLRIRSKFFLSSKFQFVNVFLITIICSIHYYIANNNTNVLICKQFFIYSTISMQLK